MNDTTFQGDGKVAYVPVVVNAKLTKPSRADRIRAMTDEELAEWFNRMQTDAYDRGMLEDRIVGYPNNYSTWLDWLMEAKDGEQS